MIEFEKPNIKCVEIDKVNSEINFNYMYYLAIDFFLEK